MKLLSKQFYALCYDVMILLAFSMLVTMFFELFLFQQTLEISNDGGSKKKIIEVFKNSPSIEDTEVSPLQGKLKTVLQFTLLGFYFFYYHISYTRGGQTIGMKSWKIKLVSTTGKIKLSQTLMRFILAWPSFFLLGFGYLTALRDEHCLSIPDKYSGTAIVYKI